MGASDLPWCVVHSYGTVPALTQLYQIAQVCLETPFWRALGLMLALWLHVWPRIRLYTTLPALYQYVMMMYAGFVESLLQEQKHFFHDFDHADRQILDSVAIILKDASDLFRKVPHRGLSVFHPRIW
jgi:hypothetical protein